MDFPAWTSVAAIALLEGNANMDAIAEVKVLSSNYEAEYGRNSGGTITLVTKSGTQHFTAHRLVDTPA